MSEYQYYEFQTVDRPLTKREIQELRRYSTRATITPTRFTNHYEWGDFKGDPAKWMEKYFDAFLYFADWGTHIFMFRLPRCVLDLKTARQYVVGDSTSARAKGEHVILEFYSDEFGERLDDWDDDGTTWLSSLIPLRADVSGGDFRTLYLAWLLCVQYGEFDDGEPEPPVPAGLNELTVPLEAFTDFLRIDRDLITAAAERSAELGQRDESRPAYEHWVASLPEAEKTALLVRLLAGEEPQPRAALLHRYRSEAGNRPAAGEPRTVSEILSAAELRTEGRCRKEAERTAREKARREREEAAARETYLNELAKREPAVWEQIRKLIATTKPSSYDQVVGLLADLRDLGIRSGREEEVQNRIRQLRHEHSRKPSLIRRLARAGLISSAP